MNRTTPVVAALAAALSLGACAQSNAEPAAMSAPVEFESESVSATIVDATGADAGVLTATSAPLGVILRFDIDPGTLTPGWHGLHLHQKPDCSDVGVFKLSGGHVGMLGGGHGLLNPAGPEKGDLPNIHAAEDGSANAEMFTQFVTLDELMGNGGFAMIIHANPDDHITQPIGGAGPRKACAAVKG